MRPLLFLVADKNMEYALRGFFERNGWHRSVPCTRFEFDPGRDVRVATGHNDPGLYARADALLRPFHGSYERVVVMIDAHWQGTPGPAAIRKEIERHLRNAGWKEADSLALVLDPEVDVWLWSDSPHAAKALGWRSPSALRSALEAEGWLGTGDAKPKRPKEAAEWALRQRGKPRSSAIYRSITATVSIERCQDPALHTLRATLRRWFPP